jgi:hypothetical protein
MRAFGAVPGIVWPFGIARRHEHWIAPARLRYIKRAVHMLDQRGNRLNGLQDGRAPDVREAYRQSAAVHRLHRGRRIGMILTELGLPKAPRMVSQA